MEHQDQGMEVTEAARFPSMSPEEKAQLVAINREIAVFATRKDLQGATFAFQRATRAGWANSHTFSAMINTHVRCGDIDGAVAVFERLKSSRIRLDVVSCTTMIKGFCSVGNIGAGVALLHEMKRRNLAPNIRTINTIIRGCLSTGSCRVGHNIFSTMKSVFGVTPDSSSWEYEGNVEATELVRFRDNSAVAVYLLCQGLQLEKVLPMIGRFDSESGDLTHSMSAIFGAVAKSAALRGEWSLARKYMRLCADAMAAETTAPVPADEDQDLADSRNHVEKQTAVGGKRAWKEMDESREQSLAMYREHKRAELRQDMKMLETYILTAAAGGPAADLYFFGKVLSFDPLNEGSSDALLPLILLKNLVEKFGLDCFIQRQLRLPTPPSIKSSAILSAVMQLDDVGSLLFVDPSAVASLRGAKKKKLKGNGVAEYSKLDVETSPISVDSVLNRDSSLDASDAESILRNIGFRLRSYLTAEGKIDFSAVFSDQSDLRSGALPLRLEICSGGGEWAAQQARTEVGIANWVTLEIKQDRVYQTFLRMVFENVRNLCAISGDAFHVLPHRFNACSVNSIFINHPEPPVQYGGESKRQKVRGGDDTGGLDSRGSEAYGKHLLNLEFFAELEKILIPGGTITLVTDNLWYGRLILLSFSTLPHPRGLQSITLKTNQSEIGTRGHYTVQEELSGHILYKGRPGRDCGHTSEESSSYFDRLWNRDNHPERYFFYFRKVDSASGLSLRIAPKGNMSRMKNVPDNYSATKTFAATAKTEYFVNWERVKD